MTIPDLVEAARKATEKVIVSTTRVNGWSAAEKVGEFTTQLRRVSDAAYASGYITLAEKDTIRAAAQSRLWDAPGIPNQSLKDPVFKLESYDETTSWIVSNKAIGDIKRATADLEVVVTQGREIIAQLSKLNLKGVA